MIKYLKQINLPELSTKNKTVIVVVFLLIINALLHVKTINYPPSFTHAWAQADRFSIAMGFYNNDLKLFKPETYTYNKNFPDSWNNPHKSTITSVDFPVHEYCVAVIMKLINSHQPWVMRVYTLIYSLFGLFFLYKLAFLLTNCFYRSLFVTVFLSTSPVFVFYQSSFLPTIPSLANAIIGFFFYAKYLKINRDSYFNISVLFLTLATLNRTSFAVALVAVFSYELCRLVVGKSRLLPKIVPVLLSIGVFLAYYFYNWYLRQQHGSLFLNYLTSLADINLILEVLEKAYQNWKFDYFSKFHYVLFICIAVLSLIYIKRLRNSPLIMDISFLMLILLFGNVLFVVAMIKQFPAHDYYFLDSVYLPIVLLFILLISIIPISKRYRHVELVVLISISLPLINKAMGSQKNRTYEHHWDDSVVINKSFNGSENFLDSLGIDFGNKILVIDSYAPNLPFVHMNRKGYIVRSPSRANIEKVFKWDWDYLVFASEKFTNRIFPEYPEIINLVDKIADNGKITVCKPLKSTVERTVYEFIGISNKQPLFKEFIDYESNIFQNWKNIRTTYDKVKSGEQAGKLMKSDRWGPTFTTNDINPAAKKKGRLFVKAYASTSNKLNNISIIVSLFEGSKRTYYKEERIDKKVLPNDTWQLLFLEFNLPEINSQEYELSVFISNPGGNELYIDEFEISIFK